MMMISTAPLRSKIPARSEFLGLKMPTIPRELECVCQKVLAKRASERYNTAWDMAEDLRHFHQTDAAAGLTATAPGAVSPPPGSTREDDL